MVYSSFVNVFGPGSLIKKEFEKICGCRLKWIKVPDSTLFVQRLSLKKDGFKTDVVLGLDQLSLKKALTLSWKEIPSPDKNFVPPVAPFLSNYFIPYSWSPMSLLSRKKLDHPLSLKDLLNKKFQHNISLPSPTSSTVGLQFYYWVWFVFQEKTKDFFKTFKKQLYGLPPSWSTSYALFQRSHVNFSFSYLSSLLYHREQKQSDFYFVFFKEGHPFQVEMAGVTPFCTQCVLAKQFVHFLLEPKIQNILKTKNYMLPVINSSQKDFPFLQNIKLISYKALPSFWNQHPMPVL